jgi:acyl carrier protein
MSVIPGESRAGAGPIADFIMDVLVEKFDQERDELSGAVSLKELGIDSLGGVELALALKRRYGVSFVAGEITVEFSLDEIAALAQAKLTDGVAGGVVGGGIQ